MGREFITTTDSSATPHHFVPPLCLHLFGLTLYGDGAGLLRLSLPAWIWTHPS